MFFTKGSFSAVSNGSPSINLELVPVKMGKALRPTVGLVLLVILLFLLTYATRGPQTLPAGLTNAELDGHTASAALIWLLIVMVLVGTTVFFLVLMHTEPAGAGKKKRVDERKTPWQAWAVFIGFLGGFVGLLLWLYRLARERQMEELSARAGGGFPGGTFGGWLGSAPVDTVFHEPPAAVGVLGWLMIGSGMLLFAAFLWRISTWKSPEEPLAETVDTKEQQVSELLETLELSLAELVAEPDPRRAIEACYHQFLRLLDKQGLSIPDSYTAEESLAAALAHFSLPTAAITTLISLFELAKFSPHPVTEEDKKRTIAALQQCREHLTSRAEKRK